MGVLQSSTMAISSALSREMIGCGEVEIDRMLSRRETTSELSAHIVVAYTDCSAVSH